MIFTRTLFVATALLALLAGCGGATTTELPPQAQQVALADFMVDGNAEEQRLRVLSALLTEQGIENEDDADSSTRNNVSVTE